MGDDGAGCRAAELLASDPRLPSGIEVICGGSDVLRLAGMFEDRRCVVLIDAIARDAPPGQVEWVDEGAVERHTNAHHLSVTESVALLKLTTGVPIRILGISVNSAAAQPDLSPELAAAMPGAVQRIIAELRREFFNDRTL
jgi:hydrogenase maturation protease